MATPMTTAARIQPLLAQLRADPRALRRVLIAGAGWGVLFAAAFTALRAWQCGSICLEETLTLTAISVAAGILTMGPLAALGRARR